MAQVVFDVIAKNPENPHIAQDMKESSVHEHGSQDRQDVCAKRVLRQAGDGADEIVRDQSELRDQQVHRAWTLNLYGNFDEQIHRDIQPNNEVVYEGRAVAGLVIANGKEHRTISEL